MQQQLLDLAVAAGVELLRPAEVTGVIPGNPPTLTLRAAARLVVGADGRNSRVRGWAGFPVGRDPDCVTATGILYRDLALPEDAVQFVLNPDVQQLSIIFPIGNRRFRAYVAFRHGAQALLSGTKDQDRFVEL
jgi:2-polyprenyl-6-methoxyphenol hydroxylase-like FAD-dependent oxidoreductase